MDWRIIALAAAGILVAGFGVETMKSLPPDTPVIIDLIPAPPSSAIKHYATLDCIRAGNSLEGYVKDRAQLRASEGPIELTYDAEVTTLSRARRLVHDGPAKHAPDPICVNAGAFEGVKQSLIMSFFD